VTTTMTRPGAGVEGPGREHEERQGAPVGPNGRHGCWPGISLPLARPAAVAIVHLAARIGHGDESTAIFWPHACASGNFTDAWNQSGRCRTS